MQRILVTGANGFIGNYLIEYFASDFEVLATSKGDSRFSFSQPNLKFQSMDFTDPNQVSEVFNVFKPSIVIHSGARSKPDECELNREEAFKVNVTGTELLLTEAKKYEASFIHLSTDFVFSGEEGMYNEDDETGPVNYYGETKLLAEQKVKDYPCRWAIVRTVLVYGHPRSGRQNLLTNVALSLQKGEEVRIFDDQLRTPTYVEDIAMAIVTIIKMGRDGVYHISGADKLSPYQMACAVADHLDLDKSLVKRITAADLQQPAKRPPKTGFNLSKARKDLGYMPTPFEEGLKKTFQ